jgi:hypothetical protein
MERRRAGIPGGDGCFREANSRLGPFDPRNGARHAFRPRRPPPGKAEAKEEVHDDLVTVADR